MATMVTATMAMGTMMTKFTRPGGSRRTEGGFILALSVLLVLILSISGMSFLHLDFLERRMVLNNVDNHGAFYVANAGTERAREVMKIPPPPPGSNFSWTSVLRDNPPVPYARDTAPNPLLCPYASTRGCVIVPFGVGSAAVTASSVNNLVFGGTFDDGQYTVRAFNNTGPGDVAGSGLTRIDGDQVLTVRALGLVARGATVEQKLLEANLLAVSALNGINCDEDEGCPDGNPNSLDFAPGREPVPGLGPQAQYLPKLNPPGTPSQPNPLLNPQNYYRRTTTGSGNPTTSNPPINFPGLQVRVFNNGFNGAVASGSYYFVTGNATITGTTSSNTSNVVVFATGKVTVNTPTSAPLTNTIVIGATDVELRGSGRLSAPIQSTTFLPSNPGLSAANYPAVIAARNVNTSSSSTKTVFGTIFAARPSDSGFSGSNGNSEMNLDDITVHGPLIGNIVDLGNHANITDDYPDPNYLKYYGFMPGFTYPPDLKTTVVVSGTWREIQ